MNFVAWPFQRLCFFSTASAVAGIAVARVFKASLLNVDTATTRQDHGSYHGHKRDNCLCAPLILCLSWRTTNSSRPHCLSAC
jgi:hypothetical protein